MSEKWTVFDVDFFWEDSFRDWFLEYGGLDSVFSGKPFSAVLLPSAVEGNFLKKKLFESGLSLSGVQFLTLGHFRKTLLDQIDDPVNPALREDLHLLASLVAEEFGGDGFGKMIGRNPKAFIRAYDRLKPSGWGADLLRYQWLKSFWDSFEDRVQQSGVRSIFEIDAILSQKKEWDIVWNRLFVYGFSSKHLSLLPLLKIAEKVSAGVDYAFLPGKQSEQELLWMGEWEQTCGEFHPVGGDFSTQREGLINYFEFKDSEESGWLDSSVRNTKFLISQDIEGLARNLLYEVLERAKIPGSRVGVVAPVNDPVLREVAQILNQNEIPFYDGFGRAAKMDSSARLVEAWIAFHKSGKRSDFSFYLNLLNECGHFSDELFQELEKLLDEASLNTLSEDIRLLVAYELGGFTFSSGLLTVLPQRDTFENFSKHSLGFLKLVGVPREENEIIERFNRIKVATNELFSVELFLEWFKEVVKPSGKALGEFGGEVLSRILLLPLNKTGGQSFSDLIVLNLDKVLDSKERYLSPFSDVSVLSQFNQKAISQGYHGEGHMVLTKGKNRILLPSDEIDLKLGQLSNLSRNVLGDVVFAERLLSGEVQVSEVFSDIYRLSEKEVLDEAKVRQLLDSSEKKRDFFADGSFSDVKMHHAFSARRDKDKPFGPYEFSFEVSPSKPIELSCKTWEKFLSSPSEVWIENVLRIRPRVASPSHRMAIGVWVHSWLLGRQAAVGSQELKEVFKMSELGAQSELLYKRVEASFQSLDRSVPDLWKSDWRDAVLVGSKVLRSASRESFSLHAFVERDLPEGSFVELGDISIPVRGRPDLVLESSRGDYLWVVDLKTGSQSSLSASRLNKGEGLQLFFYGLSLRKGKIEGVDLSVLSPEGLLEPQVSVGEVDLSPDVEKRILIAACNGVFGQSVDSYGRKPVLPVSTLSIDSEVLMRKQEILTSVEVVS